jgi:hypothetical protein
MTTSRPASCHRLARPDELRRITGLGRGPADDAGAGRGCCAVVGVAAGGLGAGAGASGTAAAEALAWTGGEAGGLPAAAALAWTGGEAGGLPAAGGLAWTGGEAGGLPAAGGLACTGGEAGGLPAAAALACTGGDAGGLPAAAAFAWSGAEAGGFAAAGPFGRAGAEAFVHTVCAPPVVSLPFGPVFGMGDFGRRRRAAEAATCSGDATRRRGFAGPAAAVPGSPGERDRSAEGGRWIGLVPGTRLGSAGSLGGSGWTSVSSSGDWSLAAGWGASAGRKPRRICAGVNPPEPGRGRAKAPDDLSGGGGRLSSAMLQPPGAAVRPALETSATQHDVPFNRNRLLPADLSGCRRAAPDHCAKGGAEATQLGQASVTVTLTEPSPTG